MIRSDDMVQKFKVGNLGVLLRLDYLVGLLVCMKMHLFYCGSMGIFWDLMVPCGLSTMYV